MASTNFTDKVTVINTDWLNDVNALTYALSGKGQLIGTTGTVIQALAAGTNGQALIADSAQSLGIKWGSEWAGWTNYTPGIAASVGSVGSVVWQSARYNYNSAGKIFMFQLMVNFSVTAGTPTVIAISYPASLTGGNVSMQVGVDFVVNGSVDRGLLGGADPTQLSFARIGGASFTGACSIWGNFILEVA